jgi:hypothetical protein
MLRSFQRLVVLALCAVPLSHAHAQTLTFEYFDDARVRGTTLVIGSGQTAGCTIAFTGKNEFVRVSCELELPSGARTIAISGELVWTDERDRTRRSRGEQTLQVADIGPLLTPLRDRSTAFAARMKAFVAAKLVFESRYPKLGGTLIDLDADERASAAEIRAVEQRLGFALPPEHVSLLTDIGRVMFDDSTIEPASSIERMWDVLVDIWDTPVNELERVTSAATREIYKTTALLFTEVGDGLGALLYMPANRTACKGRPAYYVMHQDDLNDPTLLEDKGECMDYTDALVWLVQNYVLTEYEDDEEANVVMVDRSARGPLPLRLTRYGGDGAFTFSLRPIWHLWP